MSRIVLDNKRSNTINQGRLFGKYLQAVTSCKYSSLFISVTNEDAQFGDISRPKIENVYLCLVSNSYDLMESQSFSSGGHEKIFLKCNVCTDFRQLYLKV